MLEYLRWFRISDFSLTGSCEFLQVGESFVRVFHCFASSCVFRLLSVGIPSADSRPELCGTDTPRSRCVGCNRNLFLFGFSNRILGSHSPPLWSPIWSFTCSRGDNIVKCTIYSLRSSKAFCCFSPQVNGFDPRRTLKKGKLHSADLEINLLSDGNLSTNF